MLEQTLKTARERALKFGGAYLAAATNADVHPMPYVHVVRSNDGKTFAIEPLQVNVGIHEHYPAADLVRELAALKVSPAPPLAIAVFALGAIQANDGESKQSAYIAIADLIGGHEMHTREWTPDGPLGAWTRQPYRASLTDFLAAALKVVWVPNDSQRGAINAGPRFGKPVED